MSLPPARFAISKSFMWKRTLRSHSLPLAGTTGWSRQCMRSRRIPTAALLPQKLEGRSESCGTCFTARSRTFIGSFMKSMNGGKRCGCSRSATARDGGSKGPMSHESCIWRAHGCKRIRLYFSRPMTATLWSDSSFKVFVENGNSNCCDEIRKLKTWDFAGRH